MEPLYALFERLIVAALWFWFRWRMKGLDRLPDTGPLLVACNHKSYADPFGAAYALHRRGLRARFLAKAELFGFRPLGWLLEALGQIPVRRGEPAGGGALDAARQALGTGRQVVVFPEATIGPGLPLLELKTGVARLALSTGLPVTPVALWNTCGLRFRSEIRVFVGEPVPATGTVEDLTERLRERMTELVQEASCASS